jgi:hypothetical protein
MKLSRKQWYLILLGILIILLLWWLAKIRGTSGQGATSDTGGETSAGDATLAGPTENVRVSEDADAEVAYVRRRDVLI